MDYRRTARVERERGPRRACAVNAQTCAELWSRYAESRDVGTRNSLVEEYMPLVRAEARRVAVDLSRVITPQELESAGTLGLIDSIDSFEPERGFQFVTFCTPRIRGAMLDELRSWDWTPRATRMKLHKLDRAAKSLAKELGRAPEDEEIADALGLSRAELRQLVRDRDRAVLSLDRAWDDGGKSSDDTPLSSLEDKTGPDPVRDLQRKEIVEAVRRMLSQTERLVVTLYYYEQLSLREIGRALGLTESRICQIHTKIVNRLKRQFT